MFRADPRYPIEYQPADANRVQYPDGYANPDGTSPGPAPLATLRPVGYWENSPAALTWTTGVGSVTRTAIWGSSIFDLRTDLRGVTNRELGGTPLNRTYGAQAFISISGLLGNHAGMEVYVSQWAHAVDVTKVEKITDWANITADVSTLTNAALLVYTPPGGGYQVRHWQIKLRFDLLTIAPPNPLPSISVQGGVY